MGKDRLAKVVYRGHILVEYREMKWRCLIYYIEELG